MRRQKHHCCLVGGVVCISILLQPLWQSLHITTTSLRHGVPATRSAQSDCLCLTRHSDDVLHMDFVDAQVPHMAARDVA